MSRFKVTRHGHTVSGGGGGGNPATNNIIMGMNVQDTFPYSTNLIEEDLSRKGGNGSGIITWLSNTEIPAANLNSKGQVTSLPSGETQWIMSFNSPEHPGQVNVSWSPANSVSSIQASFQCVVNSVNYVAGTAVVTPTYSYEDYPHLLGWGLAVTPGTPPTTSYSAIPVGKSSGLTANFTAQVSQMTEVGGTLRNMKRNSAEDNQGFFYYGQSSTHVNFPSSGIYTAANRTTMNSPDWATNNGQGQATPDTFPYRKVDGEPWEAMIERANTTNRLLWYCTPWNCSDDYLQAFADFVCNGSSVLCSGSCSPATNTVIVEIANEVWNGSYPVYVQAINEAHNRLAAVNQPGNVLIDDTFAPPYYSYTDPQTSVAISDPQYGAAERYCEKVIQVSKVLKARCAANGKPNAIKIVFCWQNSSAAAVAALLDYIPRDGSGTPTVDGTAVKANVDYVASAPYFDNGPLPVYCAPDINALSDALKDSIDSVTTIAGQIAAVATARGLGYMTYEGGQGYFFYPLTATCASTANTALSGGSAFPTFDGHTVSADEIVLLKNQTNAAENGLYIVGGTSSAWTLSRHSLVNSWSQIPNLNVYVQSGTANGNTQWVCSSTSGTLGSTAITFVSTPTSYNGIGTLGNELYYSSGDTTTPVSVQVSQNSIIYDANLYWLDRLNKHLPSGSVITKYANNGLPSGKFGPWGSIWSSLDMEMDAATLKSSRPTAGAIIDFIAGHRRLQALVGNAYAAVGAQVGDIVGSYKRRTFGSTPSLTGTAASALGFVDSTAEPLQLKVIDASYFASGGTITGNLVETDARDPAGSRSTAITCAVIATPIWSSATSDAGEAISNNGLTLTYESGTGGAKANQGAASSDTWWDATINNTQGSTIIIGIISNALTGWSNALVYFSDGRVARPGADLITTVASFTTGDKVRFRLKRISSTDYLFVAKWNGSSWVWQNSADPDGTGAGGWAITRPADAVPFASMNAVNAQITADFSGWA